MWKRNCPKCDSDILYSNRSNWNRGNGTNALCYNCANETRIGRKRTEEQRTKISEATQKAMDNPVIIDKIKTQMGKPEVKQKMSDNCTRQMELLKQDKIAFEEFKNLQSKLKKVYWSSVDNNKRQFHLNNLEKGRVIRWNEPNSRVEMSQQMIGSKNHFFGKRHSQETIEKLREATTKRLLKFWKDGSLHGINTKPELLVQNLLKKNNIEFVTPFVFENKIFDLYIPKYNVIIEVDGCYWHSKNVKVENMDKQQFRRWKNDRFKENLVKKNNMKLIRIWEDEIDGTTLTERIYNI